MMNDPIFKEKSYTIETDIKGKDIGQLICYTLLKLAVPIGLSVRGSYGNSYAEYTIYHMYHCSTDFDTFSENLLDGYDEWKLRFCKQDSIEISGKMSDNSIKVRYDMFTQDKQYIDDLVERCSYFINNYGYSFKV